jgi:hypothetical protein
LNVAHCGKLNENSDRPEETPQKSLRQVGKEPSTNCQGIPEITAILDSSV